MGCIKSKPTKSANPENNPKIPHNLQKQNSKERQNSGTLNTIHTKQGSFKKQNGPNDKAERMGLKKQNSNMPINRNKRNNFIIMNQRMGNSLQSYNGNRNIRNDNSFVYCVLTVQQPRNLGIIVFSYFNLRELIKIGLVSQLFYKLAGSKELVSNFLKRNEQLIIEIMRKQNESAKRENSTINLIEDEGPLKLEDIQVSQRSNHGGKDIKQGMIKRASSQLISGNQTNNVSNNIHIENMSLVLINLCQNSNEKHQQNTNTLSDADNFGYISHFESLSNLNGTAHFGQGTMMSLNEFLHNTNPNFNQSGHQNMKINFPHPQQLIDQYYTNSNSQSQQFKTSKQQFKSLDVSKKQSLELIQSSSKSKLMLEDLNLQKSKISQNNQLNTEKNNNLHMTDGKSTQKQPVILSPQSNSENNSNIFYLDSKMNKRLSSKIEIEILQKQSNYPVQQMSEIDEENLEDELEVVASMDANINILKGSLFNPSQKILTTERENIQKSNILNTFSNEHDL
eukprot:403354256